jgi:hypothetical protein
VAYISPWLTHFIGRQLGDDDARCDLLIKILSEGRLGQWERQGSVFISPGAMLIGSGSLCKDELIRFRPVCFCDIPESDLKRHTDHYSRFGLAFKKAFLVEKGANPVFYVAKGSLAGRERPADPPLTMDEVTADPRAALAKHFAATQAEEIPVKRCEFFDRLVADLGKVLPPPWPAGTPADAQDPVRDVQTRAFFDLVRHVFAFTKMFDESLPKEDKDNFYMEREWRVAGFVDFELGNVEKVYVTPGYQDRIVNRFPDLRVQEIEF